MPVGDDDVAVRPHRTGRRPDEGVLARRRYPRPAEAHQQLAVPTELVELEASPGCGGVVAERTAVAGPQLAVAVHAEAVGLDDHAVAEALLDLPLGVDIVDRRLGPEHHPRAAGAVRDEPDRGAPLHPGPQGRPVSIMRYGLDIVLVGRRDSSNNGDGSCADDATFSPQATASATPSPSFKTAPLDILTLPPDYSASCRRPMLQSVFDRGQRRAAERMALPLPDDAIR